ncbi:MAG: DUF7309 domain-containing protein [Pyrinomonadaceae bacterium]
MPTLEESKRLYELAVKLKELAPWEWMDESEIFGVQNPETDELGFISVMGMMGEHLAVGVYLGAEGLYGFWDFQDEKHETEPLALFDIPQLQVSFENRDGLKKEDRDSIKELGLKFRGTQNYPMFRRTESGFLPWFITSEDARFLIYAIEQTLEVAPRVKENPLILLNESGKKNETYLVRRAEKQNGQLVWQDEMKRVLPPTPESISFSLSQETINRLRKLPQNNNLIFEVDLFHAPTPVADKNKRPFFPKMLMISETNSRFILGFEITKPQKEPSKTQAEILNNIIKIWSNHKVLPREIRVSSDLLFNLLKGFTQQLNVKLRQTNNLIAISEAKEEMFGFFGNSFF